MADSAHQAQSLRECEREPIHIPGTIQSHGILLVLNGETLEILQVSENAGQAIGVEASALLGRSVLDLTDGGSRKALETILADASTPYSNPLRMPMGLQDGPVTIYDGIAHRTGAEIVMELENPGEQQAVDLPSSRSLDHYFQLTSRSLAAIQESSSLEEAAEVVCKELKAFTGFDRVMLYRFAPDEHGEVIGEARREDLEPFLGLHYPESDIPKQARELYKRNWIRLIHDVHAEPVPLVPEYRPLDMSDCVLRSVSPIHIQYLKNMGVASSMSISLLSGEDLWGLLACHHYSGPLFVPYKTRASCVHFGLIVSSQIGIKEESLDSQEHTRRQIALNRITRNLDDQRSFLDALGDRAESLLGVVCAEGIGILQEDQMILRGKTPEEAVVWELMAQIDRDRNLDDEDNYVTSSLAEDLPELAERTEGIAGVLAIGLGSEWRILFFRPEEEQTVRWGGDPNKAIDPDQPLTPRNSFAEWKETIRGHSRLWTDQDLAMAQELKTALISFIVQHNNQLERLNKELENKNAEIEQFAYSVSHDLKSPLVTVNGYIGALTEDLEDGNQEGVDDSLRRINRATTKMGRMIDELLQFSRVGRHPGQPMEVDMGVLFEELQEDFRLRFEEAGASLAVPKEAEPIVGYSEDIYRIFQNLIDNALNYRGDTESLTVEVVYKRLPRAVQYEVRDNGPGIDPSYHDRIFNLFQRASSSSTGSGVGLATVAKIMKQHGGSCGLESQLGEGAKFWVRFPAKLQRSTP